MRQLARPLSPLHSGFRNGKNDRIVKSKYFLRSSARTLCHARLSWTDAAHLLLGNRIREEVYSEVRQEAPHVHATLPVLELRLFFQRA